METTNKFSKFIAKLEQKTLDGNQESMILMKTVESRLLAAGENRRCTINNSSGACSSTNHRRCINSTFSCSSSLNRVKCANTGGHCSDSMNGRNCVGGELVVSQ